MRHFILYLVVSFGSLLTARTAFAADTICHDFSSDIALDMQRRETDFTAENYRVAQQSLEVTLPEWIEKRFKQGQEFPETYDKLFQGEIGLAHANALAMVKGYVLKLEYLTAVSEQKDAARAEFCNLVTQTPYFD